MFENGNNSDLSSEATGQFQSGQKDMDDPVIEVHM